jgi:LacI family repressor for deo operon, udp, cdd, tsx, nupC, and nupG
LRQLGLPIACVAEPLDGVHTERIDNEAAARLAVEHLIDLGHTRIAMIGGAPDGHELSAPAARSRGYRAALAAAGLGPGPIQDGRFTSAGGAAAMNQLLICAGGPPSAVFCQSDEMAFGALRALQQAGVRVPEHISVVGFDDHELADAFELTTVEQPISAQGAAAARWVTAGLEGIPPSGGPSIGDALHPVRLVQRGSTAPAGPPPGSVTAVSGADSSGTAGSGTAVSSDC